MTTPPLRLAPRLLILSTLTGCVYETGLVYDVGCQPAVESCNGVDDDCDGVVDDLDSGGVSGSLWYADADGDGSGDPESSLWACEAIDGWVGAADDCDDGNPAVYAGADEICDDVDNDCDGLVDGQDDSLSGGKQQYADADGDGFGDVDVSRVACSSGEGWVENAEDCDDSDTTITRCAGSSIDDGTVCAGSWGADDGEVPTWTGVCDEASGFTSYGSHCYFAVTSETVWQDARASCAAAGGYLTTLADDAEEEFVFGLVPGAYIGGCQELEGADFGWVTGESMLYTHWGPSQPDDSGDEDCLELMEDATPAWNDIWCDDRWESLGYVCEFE